MICHADSDDDDDLIMSRVVIEIVMNPMCWKSGDGNCDGWKRVLTVFVHFSHSTPPLLQRWQSTQLSDQSIFLSLWSLIAMKTRTLMKLMTTIPSFTPEPAEHQSPPPSTTTLDEVFHHHHLWHQHHGTGEHSLPSRAGGGEGEAGGVAAGGEHQLHLQPPSQAPRKWSVSGKEKSCGLIMSYSLFRDKSHTKRRGAQFVT